MKIIIDTDELAKLQADAETIVLKAEAQDTLIKILNLEKKIAEIKEVAKTKLLEEGKKKNPNFKSWEADLVRVSMRAYGAKYFVSDSEFALAPKELFSTEATVIAPNEDIETIKTSLEKAGYQVKVTKGKEGEKIAIKRAVNTKAVDKWVKEHRGMPTGIVEVKERPVSLNFAKIGEEDSENE